MFSLVICLIVFPAVNGCGVTPAGREKTINFTLSDFKLPAEMAYTGDATAKMMFPAISSTENEAKTFVGTLIMRPVKDVLYQQGRSALLPDNVISAILQQLDVQISYDPLNCENVITPMGMPNVGTKKNCVLVDRTITNICTHENMMNACENAGMVTANLKQIPLKHFSISGSLKTSNAVMASWSNQMWHSVLNRVLRMIISGPNGTYFYGTSVIIN